MEQKGYTEITVFVLHVLLGGGGGGGAGVEPFGFGLSVAAVTLPFVNTKKTKQFGVRMKRKTIWWKKEEYRFYFPYYHYLGNYKWNSQPPPYLIWPSGLLAIIFSASGFLKDNNHFAALIRVILISLEKHIVVFKDILPIRHKHWQSIKQNIL